MKNLTSLALLALVTLLVKTIIEWRAGGEPSIEAP